MAQAKPRVLAVLPSMIASCIIGVIKPLSILSRNGDIEFETTLESKVSNRALQWADIIVLCRNMEPQHSKFFYAAQRMAKCIIFDLDDNFWEIPYSEDLELASYHRAPARLKQLETYLAASDLVRVYSRPLEQSVRKFNSRVEVVRAGIDFSMLPKRVPKSAATDVVHLVYATSRIIDNQHQLFLPAIKTLLETLPDKFDMTFWGCQPAEPLLSNRVKVLPLIPDYESFFRAFGQCNFDIGLAPLCSDNFTLSKTNTKYRDYGASRVSGLYSNVSVYSGCVENEQTGLLVENTLEDWTNGLRRLIFDEQLRERIRAGAYNDVRNNYALELSAACWLKQIHNLVVDAEGKSNKLTCHTRTVHVRTIHDNFSGIKINPGTALDINPKLILEILTPNGETLRSTAVTHRQKEDGTQLQCGFFPIVNSRDRDFVLKITNHSRSSKQTKSTADEEHWLQNSKIDYIYS